VLNLLLNACAASPVRGTVELAAWVEAGGLKVAIADAGPGLPAEMVGLLREPAAPRVPDGQSGLGVWTSARLVARLEGGFEVETGPGRGTRITLTLPVPDQLEYGKVA